MLLLRALELDLSPAAADHRRASRFASATLRHVHRRAGDAIPLGTLPRSGADIILTGCRRCKVAAAIVGGGVPRPFIVVAVPSSQEETLGFEGEKREDEFTAGGFGVPQQTAGPRWRGRNGSISICSP